MILQHGTYNIAIMLISQLVIHCQNCLNNELMEFFVAVQYFWYILASAANDHLLTYCGMSLKAFELTASVKQIPVSHGTIPSYVHSQHVSSTGSLPVLLLTVYTKASVSNIHASACRHDIIWNYCSNYHLSVSGYQSPFM